MTPASDPIRSLLVAGWHFAGVAVPIGLALVVAIAAFREFGSRRLKLL